VAGLTVAAFCAVRSLENAILTKTAIKSMAFVIGCGDIRWPNANKNQLRLAQPVKSSDCSSDKGDYFHGFVEGSALCPSRFELGNDTNTQ